MKVLEIKNNLVKISYEAKDNLALSGFVIIEDSNSPYVAQVVNLKGDSTSNYAIVKLLFTFDEEGILKNYNGTVPSANANISTLPANELLEIIPVETPIFIGNLAQQNFALKVDQSIFENNLLICSDNLYDTTNLLDNLINQINEKTVIVDTDGQMTSDTRIKLGKDFKLPLNYETIDFIYENDLDDVEAVNKAIIQDIFIEVQNYVKTLPEKFIPFEAFINVIDSQYKEMQIPELILLKNKLLKYKSLNIFAENLKEIMDLSIAVENNNSLIIDISDIPDSVKKEVLRYLYEVLNRIDAKIYSFVKVNNSNVTKRLLKKFIEKSNVFTTIICPHDFKYIEDVKEVSQNMIFFAPMTLTHDFASYNTFLSKLNNSEFVIYGAHTQNIPFIVEITDIDDMASPESNPETENSIQNPFAVEVPEDEVDENDVISVDDLMINEEELEETPKEETFQNTEQEESTADEIQSEIEISENEVSNEKDGEEIFDDSEVINEKSDNVAEIVEQDEPKDFQEEFIENNVENLEDEEKSEETDISDELTFQEDSSVEETSELDSLKNEETDERIANVPEEDKTVDQQLADEPEEDEPVVEPLMVEHEQMVEQVSKDVDRMFYEKINDNEPDDDFADTSEDLTEEDLNIIEDMADIPLAGELDETLPPVEEDEQPPVVPIYPADDIESADTHDFQPGERVLTAKYGEGVVQKMIKYGNKMLCSIEFPSIGRRLLDPAITEITKIN